MSECIKMHFDLNRHIKSTKYKDAILDTAEVLASATSAKIVLTVTYLGGSINIETFEPKTIDETKFIVDRLCEIYDR